MSLTDQEIHELYLDLGTIKADVKYVVKAVERLAAQLLAQSARVDVLSTDKVSRDVMTENNRKMLALTMSIAGLLGGVVGTVIGMVVK